MKRDFDGAVNAFTSKIEELEGMPHKLVEQMDAWREEAAKINEDRDLSGEGKSKRFNELKQRVDTEMAQLDAAFDRDFGSFDGALAHLQNERNSDEPDLPEPPEGLRLSGEKAIWKQNAQLERRIGKLESLLENQHRQNLLKAELESMDADTLMRKADWAWKAGDKTAMEIFGDQFVANL